MEPPISPSDAIRKPARKPLTSDNPKTQYLIFYNFVSALLWLVVLGRVLLLVPLVGFGRTYSGVGRFAKYTQTIALLEILHAAIGTHTHTCTRIWLTLVTGVGVGVSID
jgi:very-long-chain (3R)-3-hydroxyacyl-CoA dehydratase